MSQWIKTEHNGIEMNVLICKHKLPYIECDECMPKGLTNAKVINMEVWWRKLLRKLRG